MDLYAKVHPTVSPYEINTLWNDLGPMSIDQINDYIDKYVYNWKS